MCDNIKKFNIAKFAEISFESCKQTEICQKLSLSVSDDTKLSIEERCLFCGESYTDNRLVFTSNMTGFSAHIQCLDNNLSKELVNSNEMELMAEYSSYMSSKDVSTRFNIPSCVKSIDQRISIKSK